MNFEHTEDRRMLSDMLRRFVAEQYDIATRHRNAGAERGHSPEFWRRYAELGAIGALFAERDGGGRRRFRHRRGVRGAGARPGGRALPGRAHGGQRHRPGRHAGAARIAGRPDRRRAGRGAGLRRAGCRLRTVARLDPRRARRRGLAAARTGRGQRRRARRPVPGVGAHVRRRRRGRRHQPVPGRGQRAGPERPWLRAGRRRPRPS